jgi:hypothetical protein
MVEHLFCKQAVAGSIPIAGSIFDKSSLFIYGFLIGSNGEPDQSKSM